MQFGGRANYQSAANEQWIISMYLAIRNPTRDRAALLLWPRLKSSSDFQFYCVFLGARAGEFRWQRPRKRFYQRLFNCDSNEINVTSFGQLRRLRAVDNSIYAPREYVEMLKKRSCGRTRYDFSFKYVKQTMQNTYEYTRHGSTSDIITYFYLILE